MRPNLRIVFEVTDGFGAVDVLHSSGKGFGVFVGHERFVPAHGFQDEVRIRLDVHFPFRPAADIIDFTGAEVIHNVCEGAARVFHKVDYPFVPLEDDV